MANNLSKIFDLINDARLATSTAYDETRDDEKLSALLDDALGTLNRAAEYVETEAPNHG